MDLIKNIEIPDLEAIRDWSNAKLNKKVDKAEGKDLSANDYTNADKEKLDNLVQTEVKGDAESEYHKGKVNITPENIGALSNTGGNVGGPINGITTKMVEVPDQGGLDKYYLLNDITDWYNSPLGTTTITIPSTCGFTGTLISHKSNGDLDNTVNNLAIAASNGMVLDDDGDNLLLRTTNEDYAPCILKDETNNKYYLALRVRGNGRYIFFIGRFSGSVINTFIAGGNNNGDWTMPSGYSVVNKDYKIIAQTRVKGDAETEYRTGNVNITPENIGALPSKNIYRATFTKTSSSTPDLILECKFSDLSPGDLILINATNTYNTSAYIAIGTYPYIQDSSGERRQLKCQCAYVSQNGQSYRSTTTRSINLVCNACNLWTYVGTDTTYTGGLFYSLSNIYFNLSTTSSYTATSSYPFTGTGANNMYKEIMSYISVMHNHWFNASNGTYKFIPVNGKMVSNNYNINSSTAESTWVAYFNEDTPFTLKYRVSSETNFDKLTITLDNNTIVNAISGAGEELIYETTLSSGVHTLYAKYVKDGSQHKNDDRAYLEFDNVLASATDIVSSDADSSEGIDTDQFALKSIYGDEAINFGRRPESTVGAGSIVLSTFIPSNTTWASTMPSVSGKGSLLLGYGECSEITANYSIIITSNCDNYIESAASYSGIFGGEENILSSGHGWVFGGNFISTTGTPYQYAALGGSDNVFADGEYGTALGGCYNIINGNQAVTGHYNNNTLAAAGSGTGTGTGTLFCIGNGTNSARSNAARIDANGKLWCKAAYSSTGADYAELFEWADSNPNDEDRRGYFVTMDGNKIKKAKSNDWLLGVVSANPCVLGNTDTEWQGQFLKDEFGAYLIEDFTEIRKRKKMVPKTDEDGNEIYDENGVQITKEIEVEEEISGSRYVLNPDYDPDMEYTDRISRREWDAVGMMGVLAVFDDGTCEVNGFCVCNDDGIATATATASKTGYRVISRIADNIVKIVFSI